MFVGGARAGSNCSNYVAVAFTVCTRMSAVFPPIGKAPGALPALAKHKQHAQYKEAPTSAMPTLDALNAVEQFNSTLMVLAHAAAVRATCESCKAKSRQSSDS